MLTSFKIRTRVPCVMNFLKSFLHSTILLVSCNLFGMLPENNGNCDYQNIDEISIIEASECEESFKLNNIDNKKNILDNCNDILKKIDKYYLQLIADIKELFHVDDDDNVSDIMSNVEYYSTCVNEDVSTVWDYVIQLTDSLSKIYTFPTHLLFQEIVDESEHCDNNINPQEQDAKVNGQLNQHQQFQKEYEENVNSLLINLQKLKEMFFELIVKYENFKRLFSDGSNDTLMLTLYCDIACILEKMLEYSDDAGYYAEECKKIQLILQWIKR